MNPIFIGANIQNIHYFTRIPPIFYIKNQIKYILKEKHPPNDHPSREFHITFFASSRMTEQRNSNTSKGAQCLLTKYILFIYC